MTDPRTGARRVRALRVRWTALVSVRLPARLTVSGPARDHTTAHRMTRRRDEAGVADADDCLPTVGALLGSRGADNP